MIFLGLNEFNFELISEAAKVFDLKNFQKLISLNPTACTTKDTYDSNFLEPWVQWVSVQTGQPSSLHHIKHLGDIPSVKHAQLWEELSRRGVTSGIWGAMNATRGKAKKCLFFLPDPWTFSEAGYPSDINTLLSLPRYLAKNYLDLAPTVIVRKALGLLGVLAMTSTRGLFIKEIPQLLKNCVRFKGEHFPFISATDLIMAHLFLNYRRKYKPQFSMIFLNSLAHLQHHHWSGDLKDNERLRIGLTYLDRALGFIFADLKEKEIFICTNALSQKNTNSEKPWVLYRQKDQKRFLKALGVKVDRVEPHMTHDAHIFFKTENECLMGAQILKDVTVDGQKLFVVETYEDSRKLFYRIDFTDQLKAKAIFLSGDKRLKFFDHFEAIVTRTGKHIPIGNILCNRPLFPKTILNHEIFDFVLKAFEKPKAKPKIKRVAKKAVREIHV
jgi:hypothetical protein